MSYSTTVTTAWSSGTNGSPHHHPDTTHPTGLYISTTSSNSSLKRRNPSGTSLASISTPDSNASPSDFPSTTTAGTHHTSQPQPQQPSKSRHRPSLSVSSIASSLAAGLPGISSSTSSTTISSPQKKLRPPPVAAAGVGGVITAFDQGLTRIAADVGSSLALLTKKATATPPLHHHHHHHHHYHSPSQYSYQALPGYCPERDESHLTFSSSSTTHSTFSAMSNNNTGNSYHSNTGAAAGGGGAFREKQQDQAHRRSTGSSVANTNSNTNTNTNTTRHNGDASWFGSLRGLVIAGSSASRGAFSLLTMDDDKDRHSDSEHSDMDEDEDNDHEDAHSFGPPLSPAAGSLTTSSEADRVAATAATTITTTTKGNGFWDREMDEEKYGVAPPPLPPSSSSSSSSSIATPSALPPGKTYRTQRWTWSSMLLDPSQLGRSLLTPLYQSIPASAADADLDDHLEESYAKDLDDEDDGDDERQGQRPRRYHVIQH